MLLGEAAPVSKLEASPEIDAFLAGVAADTVPRVFEKVAAHFASAPRT